MKITTRHMIDRPSQTQDLPRLRAFLNIERRLGAQSAARSLHRQPRLAGSGKLRHFLRIQMGHQA